MTANDPASASSGGVRADAQGDRWGTEQRRSAEHFADGAVQVIPVVEERLLVSKRSIEGERVRVRLVTDEVAEVARVGLRSERIEVERVPIGRAVETAPPVREEDGVTIIPILEEVVVVEKRLVLREELRVHRVAETREEAQPVTPRRERAEVERLPPPTAEDGQPGATPHNPGHTES